MLISARQLQVRRNESPGAAQVEWHGAGSHLCVCACVVVCVALCRVCVVWCVCCVSRRVRSDRSIGGLEPRALYNLIDFLMMDSNADGVISVDEARHLMFVVSL